MLQWAYPWFAVLLLTPILMRWWPPYRAGDPVLRAPMAERLHRLSGGRNKQQQAPRTRWFQQMVYCLAWAALVAAIARPQWLEEPISQTQPKRDLLLAIDLSGSMATEDFTDEAGQTVDRLTAVKQVMGNFLQGRESERVGLIVFGTAPFVQMPFSEDLEVVQTMLNETEVAMAGPRTMLGDAIGLAITVFERSELDQHLMIVLTDGNDTGSLVPPQRAAELAAERGITIFTVGVGDPAQVGEAPLDEVALRRLAQTTGGRLFLATDQQQLAAVYDELGRLNPVEVERLSYRPRVDLFHWPLAISVLLLLTFHGWPALMSLLHRQHPKVADQEVA
ncbi:MAG: membrane protein [Lysobacteraceae bacterium]|nr:MAG: membrane protein [Xanthomonadaceae bacterium]